MRGLIPLDFQATDPNSRLTIRRIVENRRARGEAGQVPTIARLRVIPEDVCEVGGNPTQVDGDQRFDEDYQWRIPSVPASYRPKPGRRRRCGNPKACHFWLYSDLTQPARGSFHRD